MDAKDAAKKELIDKIISLMVEPNIKVSKHSDEDEKKFVDFISSVKSNKKTTQQMPIEFALRYEMFNLIKDGHVFINGSVKFVANFTTEKPTTTSQVTFKALYRGNEFKYSFLDNHPGIINIDTVLDIPVDYEGLMAVPLTILNYKNIVRFNIHRVIYTPKFRGKCIYPRIVVSNKLAITD